MRSVFSKNVIFTSLLLSLSSVSLNSSAEFQADVGFASEYVRQGIKQSNAKPVFQGNVIFHSQTGLYGGLWGSGINRGSPDSTRFELDGFAGFYLPLTESIDLDIGYTHATFLGETDASENPYGVSDNSYGEGFLNILINQSTTLGYRYSPDFFGSGEDQQVIFVGGGNTKSMLAVWQEWKLDKLFLKAYNNGKILANHFMGKFYFIFFKFIP